MSELRPSISAALAKAGRKLTAAELYTLLGTSEPKKKVNATIFRMKTDGSIKAFSGDSPHKTLYAPGGANGKAQPAAHAPPKNGKGNGHDHTHAARPEPEASPKPGATPSAQCNVAQFVPAMTADKRLVMVGGSEPLIFSTEQTQSIADLIFENFEANT